MPSRILVLSASVGAGHLRAAQAVELALRELDPAAVDDLVKALQTLSKLRHGRDDLHNLPALGKSLIDDIEKLYPDRQFDPCGLLEDGKPFKTYLQDAKVASVYKLNEALIELSTAVKAVKPGDRLPPKGNVYGKFFAEIRSLDDITGGAHKAHSRRFFVEADRDVVSRLMEFFGKEGVCKLLGTERSEEISLVQLLNQVRTQALKEGSQSARARIGDEIEAYPDDKDARDAFGALRKFIEACKASAPAQEAP